MYTSLSIENFRLFDKLTVEPLARVNLIAGQNNVGKTALLEALWMLSHPTAPRDALWHINRGVSAFAQTDFFADLFPQYQTELTITLRAEDRSNDGFKTLSIQRKYRAQQPIFDWSRTPETELDDDRLADLDFSNELEFEFLDETGSEYLTRVCLDAVFESGVLRPMLRYGGTLNASLGYPCTFEYPRVRESARTFAARFGRAEREGFLPAIEKAVQLLEPKLKRLTTITDNRGTPSIYGDIGAGRLFPLSVMGEGTKRLLALSLAFLNARNGVMLIDEVENGLHHSALTGVWKNLEWLSREFNVQVFATTHSYECVKAAHTAFKVNECGDELSYIRLQRNIRTQRIECVSYDDPEAFDYAMEYGREVR